jgi:hypothetical protein
MLSGATKPRSKILLQATPAFTGREDILSELDRYFASSNVEMQQVFVLYGLGGGGKTQIALRFIEKFYHWCGVFLVDVATLELIVYFSQFFKHIFY